MACLLRHPGQSGLPLLILVGCGAPISNAPFREEGAFLDALLTVDDVAAPPGLLGVELADGLAPLLAQSRVALDRYTGALSGPLEVCARLAEAGPDGRTDVRRTWLPRPLTLPVGGPEVFATRWIQAEVVRDAETSFEIRITAGERETAQIPAGVGSVDEAGATWGWELAALGAGDELPLGLAIEAETDEAPRRVVVRSGVAPVFDETWVVEGPAFAYTDRFAVTLDGQAWPGSLTVVHGPRGGGASGEIDIAGDPVDVTACWEPDGTAIWQGGADPRLASSGDPSACPDLTSSPP